MMIKEHGPWVRYPHPAFPSTTPPCPSLTPDTKFIIPCPKIEREDQRRVLCFDGGVMETMGMKRKYEEGGSEERDGMKIGGKTPVRKSFSGEAAAGILYLTSSKGNSRYQ
ncbi:hypothetical protein WG66_000895 [Moniliophthora roreri]|nr:hypothetical protein WG66_000895 [Moniliophthora roreri]